VKQENYNEKWIYGKEIERDGGGRESAHARHVIDYVKTDTKINKQKIKNIATDSRRTCSMQLRFISRIIVHVALENVFARSHQADKRCAVQGNTFDVPVGNH